jgi:hypothetical protein
MLGQAFFDPLGALDVFQNLEFLLCCEYPPLLLCLVPRYHLVLFPLGNDSLILLNSVSLVKKQVIYPTAGDDVAGYDLEIFLSPIPLDPPTAAAIKALHKTNIAISLIQARILPC